MAGTIYSGRYRIGSNGTYSGITLSNAATQNPATLSNYIYTNSGAAILGQAGTAWTVSNQGLLIDYGMGGKAGNYGSTNNPGGIVLLDGGVVLNGNTSIGGQGGLTGGGPFYADGRLEETTFGIAITGGIGTVINDGMIKSSGTGVSLGDGGTIVNGAPNDTIAYIAAASVISGGPGTVLNYATLGHGGLLGGGGIALTAGGFIQNFAGAYVKNFTVISGAAGTIVNAGTLNHSVALSAGGTVANQASGSIRYGLYLNGAAGTLTNAGLINAQTTFGAAGQVTNTGTILGSAVGLKFVASGTLVNGQSGSAAGLINGQSYGVSIAGPAGLITNFGNIQATGATNGGAAIGLSQAGTIINFGGLLESGGRSGSQSLYDAAVRLNAGGSLFNAGTLIGGSAGAYAIGGSITNSGLIGTSGTTAVLLKTGFLNNSGGTILAASAQAAGVGATNATVVNSGLIGAAGTSTLSGTPTVSGTAVSVIDGTLINSGTLLAKLAGTVSSSSFAVGVGIGGTIGSTIINNGTILGGTGVLVGIAQSFTSAGTAFYVSPNATIIDSGTIEGTLGYAVAFGAGVNLLKLLPGASFTGVVDGISPFPTSVAGNSTLEFGAGVGSLSGLGTNVEHFRTIRIDPGADWTLGGTILAGVTLANDGTMLANQGTLLVRAPLLSDAGSTGTIAVAGHGVAAVYGTVASSQTAQFIDLVGSLEIGSLGGFAGTIAGFAAGDTITLLGTTANAASYANHLLTISNGATVLGKIAVSKNYTGDNFTAAVDAAGNTDITTNAPCFAAGTRLLTDEGDIPVEALRVGHVMITASGARCPVIWLGRRRIDCRLHPRPEQVWPVRILAGAFGPGLPLRDVLLSPDHAVAWENALIPVRYLVNGMTVVQAPADQVEYWHVELDGHDVLLAEGLPAESYRDTGNRAQFEGGGLTTLHPDLAAGGDLILAGTELARTKAHLLARAAALGWQPPLPLMQLEIDGRRVRPVVAEAGRHRFLLPHGGRIAQIRSTTWVPGECTPDAQDRRRLGVCVAGLVVDGCTLPLDGEALLAGFHPIERHRRDLWRWTDGCGLLRVPPAASVLEILLLEEAKFFGSFFQKRTRVLSHA